MREQVNGLNMTMMESLGKEKKWNSTSKEGRVRVKEGRQGGIIEYNKKGWKICDARKKKGMEQAIKRESRSEMRNLKKIMQSEGKYKKREGRKEGRQPVKAVSTV